MKSDYRIEGTDTFTLNHLIQLLAVIRERNAVVHEIQMKGFTAERGDGIEECNRKIKVILDLPNA